ncbi:hypothetical protein H0H92_011467 [Tricholoma furcatifolium]|nr:hypothetical protein H0H92_011467 [Tricholoma furcatifolium]
MVDPNIEFYGFTPVPRDPDVLFAGHPTASGDHPKQDTFKVTDFPLPDSEVVREVKAFVKTYYLACLLHDIGTAEKFLATTKLSFEFKGAIIARDLILKVGGVEDQADSVCDAIVRHQDIFVKGRANLIHPGLIESTCAAFPRNGWSECFAQTVERELALKPWSHTSSFEVPNWKEGLPSKFATDVRGNDIMRPFD